MKILCVLGSPRPNGNSATIAKRFIETARSLGAEVQNFELNKMNYRGCQGCGSCKTKTDKCATKDDLTAVLDAIPNSDVILVSSPVYYQEVTGQVKSFIDRLYAFMPPNYLQSGAKSRVPEGKKVILITTQGAPETAMVELPKRYATIFQRTLAAGEVKLLRACGVGGGGVVINIPDKYLLEAEALAKAVCA
jgi:multimeric flavodoxin WrbA